MFLCKDVAMQYVAVRSLNKKIMKNTNFYGCIEGSKIKNLLLYINYMFADC